MSVRRVSILASVLAVALAAAVTPAIAAKAYRAQLFHSRVVIEPGGAVVVTETVRFVFGSDSFTYVSRELPTRRTDGLTILGAAMDGTPMERGKAAGQYEVRRDDNRRRIVWHFPATSSATREFTVTYRAAGVVWQDADADVLAWTLIPARHEYAIDCVSGEVLYPEGAVPAADAVFDPPPSMVGHEGRTVRFERCPVGPDASWVVTMRFAGGSVAPVAPRWQQRSALNRENLPLFLGLGGLILFAGAGGFLLFALRHRHERLGGPGAVVAPPDGLPPALAGALTAVGASVGWGPVLGATMDLARRGALTIQGIQKPGLFKSHEVRVSRGPTTAGTAPHEAVLLDLLFTDKHGPRSSVTFSELAKTFASSRRWKRLKEAIASDMRAERLLDGDRERTRGRVTVAGLVILLSSIAGFVTSVAFFDRTGEAVLLLPVAVLVVGVVGLATGLSLSPLSEEGARRAERWRAFKRALTDEAVAPVAAASSTQRLERWLPYAVAFGSAVAWTKRLQKQGVALGPSWLSSVSQEGAHVPANIGATVAILAAGASAGANAGGHAGGGAGAAGGGSSGAG